MTLREVILALVGTRGIVKRSMVTYPLNNLLDYSTHDAYKAEWIGWVGQVGV